MILRFIVRAALIFFLSPLAVSPASACRGNWFEEQESAPFVRGFPFPDVIESLPRRTTRIPTSTCGPSKNRFSVLYGNENVEWAEIIILDLPKSADQRRNSTPALDQNHQVLSEILQKLAKSRSTSQETVTLLSTEVGGFAGFSLLTRKIDGAEFKTFSLPVSMPSKFVRIEYKTYNFNDAESRALNFRNAYTSRIISLVAKEGTPDSIR